ncbi:AsnC family protein [Alkalihalobacillus sp. R86527]|uniref:AsnC family protein n=1 Tax=Alkalihalobacillus sp. R86527 TaxID=3093863 RepID=UPI003670C796
MIDKRIIELLVENGRMSYADIGKKLDLSRVSVRRWIVNRIMPSPNTIHSKKRIPLGILLLIEPSFSSMVQFICYGLVAVAAATISAAFICRSYIITSALSTA